MRRAFKIGLGFIGAVGTVALFIIAVAIFSNNHPSKHEISDPLAV